MVASRSAATADAGLARSVTPPDPGGGIGAGQLTCEQFLKRARDRGEARDATDIRFEDVVPSIRLRYAPGNALDWRNKQDEPPPWLYERGGEVVMGFAGGEKDWAKIAGYVHAVEVEHAIAQSREEKGPPVPPHVLNQYGVDTAGRRARRGSGQGGGGVAAGRATATTAPTSAARPGSPWRWRRSPVPASSRTRSRRYPLEGHRSPVDWTPRLPRAGKKRALARQHEEGEPAP